MIGGTFSLAQWIPGWSGTLQEEYRFVSNTDKKRK
jgi:hypothetical protein